MPRIAKVELLPLAVPGPGGDDCDSSCDTLVVRVTDESGLSGIGECDAPPMVAKSFLVPLLGGRSKAAEKQCRIGLHSAHRLSPPRTLLLAAATAATPMEDRRPGMVIRIP